MVPSREVYRGTLAVYCLNLLGRYFSTTIASVAVRVMGVRTPYEGDCLQKSYYISDGLYGSLGCARFDPFMEFTPLF